MVAVRGDCGDLCDLRRVGADFLCKGVELGVDGFDCFVDTALEAHRVCAGCDVLEAFLEDGFGENGCRCGAVAGGIGGLACHFLDHLRTHVLVGVRKFNFLGYADTVLGDGGGAEFLVENDIASFRAECGFDRRAQLFHTGKKLTTCLVAEQKLFCCHNNCISL